MDQLIPRCHVCGSTLFVHDRETLCQDCTSYTLAEPVAEPPDDPDRLVDLVDDPDDLPF
jgi:hypothetical protein